MSRYRRLRAPGATYYFEACLQRPGSDLLVAHVDLLRAAWAATARDHPFHCDAVAILPDRIHTIWTLPPGDADFSTRWQLLKSRFTRALHGPAAQPRDSLLRRREAGIWQRRFWEHRIRDDADLSAHRDLVLNSPVRAGLAARPDDWDLSSIHRDRRLAPAPQQAVA